MATVSMQRQGMSGTYQDAELILKLFEMRREEKMREARRWFQAKFKPTNVAEYQQQTATRETNAYFRRVINYWETACMFVARGILNEEMFFESCGEMLTVWEKVRPFLAEIRKQRKNPLFLKYTEHVALRYIDWVKGQAPEAYDWIVSLNNPD
jgi:hypothetical protein